jgi:hypothetical protein
LAISQTVAIVARIQTTGARNADRTPTERRKATCASTRSGTTPDTMLAATPPRESAVLVSGLPVSTRRTRW